MNKPELRMKGEGYTTAKSRSGFAVSVTNRHFPPPLTLNPRHGFTLVELLVYLASMTVVLLALTYMIATTYGLYGSLLASSRADRAAGTLMQILATELRAGAAIDQADSVFNAALGQLTIDAYDGTTEIEKLFRVSGARVVLEVDGTSTYLTPSDMEVSRFLFTQIATPVSYAVRYELALTYTSRGQTVTKTYPGLVVMRRSYD